MDSYPGDFPFGIMDVVELLHLRIRRRQANSVYVDCPFCGDRRGKMNVNFVKNVWRCNYCDEHGGMLVIDFTDTEKFEETPPPVPEGKTEIKDPGQEHTVNPDPSVPEVTAPPAEQAPPSNEPVPGSSNGNGAVYDPVFGWVVPGNVQQSTGDSDGDLNKQVGNMG